MNTRIFFIFSFIILVLTVQSVLLTAWPVKILTKEEMDTFSILESNVPHTGSDASIQKVTDGLHIYVLKQINDPSLDEQYLLINDIIASTIANDIGIHINEVFFIPYSVANHLKIFPDRAATLHSYVYGKDLEQRLPDCCSNDFTIHQLSLYLLSVWPQQQPIEEHQQGLNRNIINNMSIHDDLPAIVALDTFIGNSDRSLPNIFYDSQSDHFYGIDQAAAFNINLALFANDRLKELLKDGYFLSCDVKVIYGLRKFRNVLWRLKEKFKPLILIQSMQELFPYLGLNMLQKGEVYPRIHYEAKVIEDTYCSISELITVLDQILGDDCQTQIKMS